MMIRKVRIIVALLLAVMMVNVLWLSSAAAADSWLRGDADGDGEISVLDATTVRKVVAGVLTDDDGSISRRACVTGETLSLLDATAIQWYLACLYDRYHIGEAVQAPTEPFFPIPTEDNQLPIMH